jgi:hypothetical protein
MLLPRAGFALTLRGSAGNPLEFFLLFLATVSEWLQPKAIKQRLNVSYYKQPD